MLPIDLRDTLYRRFLSQLAEPETDAFAGLREPQPARAAYLADRLPRYRKVLEAWAKAGAGLRSPRGRALALAELLMEEGLYFDCHEYLESSWKAETGAWKTFFQGLIQVAAGLHKLELDARAVRGARELREKGLEKLRRAAAGTLGTAQVERLVASLPPLDR